MGLLSLLGVITLLVLSLEPVTGKHLFQIDPRIIGGVEADRNSTRFIASLRLTAMEKAGFGTGHECGASLISENVLISAAHCFFEYPNGSFVAQLRDPCELSIVLGNYNRFTKEPTTVVRSIYGYTAHTGYNDLTKENDIAIIFLNESVPIIPGVIETIDLNDQELPIGTECQASGWGATKYNGTLANDLMSVNISVLDINRCNTSYSGYLYDGMMCVGTFDGTKDSCNGDSGGPLVCGRYLAGIVSWGYRCAVRNYPGVYTNVDFFTYWLQRSIIAGPTVMANCPIEDPSTEDPVASTASSTEAVSSTSSVVSSSSSEAPSSSTSAGSSTVSSSSPSSSAPTSSVPSTAAPSSPAPTSPVPTSSVPTSPAPSSSEPTSPAPPSSTSKPNNASNLSIQMYLITLAASTVLWKTINPIKRC